MKTKRSQKLVGLVVKNSLIIIGMMGLLSCASVDSRTKEEKQKSLESLRNGRNLSKGI